MNALPEGRSYGRSPMLQHPKSPTNDSKKGVEEDTSLEARDSLAQNGSRRFSIAIARDLTHDSSEGQNSGMESIQANSLPRGTRESSRTDDVSLSSHLGQQSVKIDPRSFVQNVFNTDAMKMLEWLTPTGIQSLTSTFTGIRKALARDSAMGSAEPTSSIPPAEQESKKAHVPSASSSRTETTLAPLPMSDTAEKMTAGISSAVINEGISVDKAPISTIPVLNKHRRRSEMAASPPSTIFKPLSASAPEIRRRDSSELDKSTKLHRGNSISDENSLQRRKSNDIHASLTSKKTRIGLASTLKTTTSFAGQEIVLPTLGEVGFSPVKVSVIPTPTVKEDDDSTVEPPKDVESDKLKNGSQQKVPQKPRDGPFPQSLAVLSIQSIELMCNILMADNILDLQANTLSAMDEARSFRHTISSIPKLKIKRLPNTAKDWKSFIEQSFFYVLSDRKALIQSFSTESNALLDSRTLTYCLMRISRVSPRVLFDSLWVVAADLYQVPRELSEIQDVGKPQLNVHSPARHPTTNDEASRLMIICFHALIAAIPFSNNANITSAASRSRGKGLSHAHNNSLADNYSLETDDVLSDPLALRLARRLFAAIPAQQTFQELEKLNNWEGIRPTHPSNILEDVIASLESFDIDKSPSMTFGDRERELHELRAATILIDWARTVMLQDWKGTAIVPADGAFGGALALLATLYKKRKSLFLTEQNFRTEFIADRLDSADMPIEWLSFASNRKTVHLLDYSFLFSKPSLVTYFRAINFSRMSGAFDASATMSIRMSAIASPTNLAMNPYRREDLNDRLRVATSKFMVLQIRRDNVLADAFDQLWRREERELLRPLKIKLGEEAGEEGSDSGGVQQEFFRMAIAEALNPDYGAFTIDDRTKMIWFQASSPEPLWKFELIGLLVGLAIYNGLTLPVTFPKALYRKVLGRPVTELHHIADGWPELASGLTALLEWDEQKGLIEDVFCRTYEFSLDVFGRQVSRNMAEPSSSPWPQFATLVDDSGQSDNVASNIPEAPLVDASNRNDYVSDYIAYLTTHSIAPQFEAFQKGFLTCLDPRSLSLFTPSLLQNVVEGVQEIDVAELRRYTRYVGWDASHHTIRDFWSVVKRYSQEELKRLLEFVTASDRVPVGGMRNLVFVVQRNGEDFGDELEEEGQEGEEHGWREKGGKGRLPTSYTCYGTLLLPEYRDRETLKKKLGMALENARGFGFA
jgi:hypothetical protein